MKNIVDYILVYLACLFGNVLGEMLFTHATFIESLSMLHNYVISFIVFLFIIFTDREEKKKENR